MSEPVEHLDVLLVGAGLSGIGAAVHLQQRLPGRSYAVLESRESLGGTWDLFRYPGIRSDSDMYTLGYRFKPWTAEKAIADGPAILDYVQETAREYGVDRHIRYSRRVARAEWSTEQARWTVRIERTDTGEHEQLTCDFLWSCSGYYRYDEGYTPTFDGLEDFAGTVVHPQHWPEALDYAGKKVVIIGSGATAVTLAPSMAQTAGSVTILQRSPTYILAMPGVDRLASVVRRRLPAGPAYAVTRWKNILVSTGVYQLCQRRPDLMRRVIRKGTVAQLPEGYPVDTHFKPAYNPWDQRLCLVPDGDLFRAIRHGEVEMVTDHVDRFTPAGIRLRSGEELEADVVVTATGLNLRAFGGIDFVVDGEPVDLTTTMAYKGMMLSGVPNFAYVIGYTNASWTLKADLVSEYVCRLLTHLDEHDLRVAVPERDPDVDEEPFLDFAAGYVLRSLDELPKQGSRAPWKLRMNYLRDVVTLRRGSIEEAMRFDPAVRRDTERAAS